MALQALRQSISSACQQLSNSRVGCGLKDMIKAIKSIFNGNVKEQQKQTAPEKDIFSDISWTLLPSRKRPSYKRMAQEQVTINSKVNVTNSSPSNNRTRNDLIDVML